MPNQINRPWLLACRPQGMAGDDDFRLVGSQIPIAADGEVLVRNLWLPFDPTQRGWGPGHVRPGDCDRRGDAGRGGRTGRPIAAPGLPTRATGSIAGQIAKILGCRVIGTAGGRAKCDWLTEKAAFDGVVDYRTEDVGARLQALCPEGIDVFFDNVGGLVLNAVLAQINLNARIVLCGAISRYNDTAPMPGPANYANLISRRGKMQGFIVLDYEARFPEAIAALAGWLREWRLKQKEDIGSASNTRRRRCDACSRARISGSNC